MGPEEAGTASNKCAAKSVATKSASVGETGRSAKRKRTTNRNGALREAAKIELDGLTPSALQRTWRKIEAAVLASAEEMVLGLVEKAKEGNPQAAKFLFDFVGIKREAATQEAEGGESLAAVLLKKLESEAAKAAEVSAGVPSRSEPDLPKFGGAGFGGEIVESEPG